MHRAVQSGRDPARHADPSAPVRAASRATRHGRARGFCTTALGLCLALLAGSGEDAAGPRLPQPAFLSVFRGGFRERNPQRRSDHVHRREHGIHRAGQGRPDGGIGEVRGIDDELGGVEGEIVSLP